MSIVSPPSTHRSPARFLCLPLSVLGAVGLTALPDEAAAINPAEIASLVVRSPLPVASDLEGVAADGTTLVAVGVRGAAASSRNGGLTWAPMPALERNGSPQDMYGIATDGARFVAVGTGAAVTADLEGWEWSTSAGGFHLDVAHGAGRFVAVGRRDTVIVSTDGLDWSPAPLPEGTSLEAVAFGNGAFVGGGTNARLVRSIDGETWDTVRAGSEDEGRVRGVSFANGRFIAGGDDGILLVSTDGIDWETPDHGSAVNLNEAAFIGGRYVLLDTLSSTQVTTDFLSLERVFFDFPGGANDIVRAGDRLVAVGRNGLIGTTADGLVWDERRERLSDGFDSIAFGAGLFVIADAASGRLFSSGNGRVWTLRWQDDSSFRTRVAFGNGVFCALTLDGRCLRSSDGTTWESVETGLGFISGGLRFLDGRFVTVGNGGGIASSADGSEWTPHDSGTDVRLNDIAFHDDLFVAVGFSDTVFASEELDDSWEPRATGVDAASFSRIESSEAGFHLFESFDAPILSPDGVTWTALDDVGRLTGQHGGVDPELGVYVLTGGRVVFNAPGADPHDWTTVNLATTGTLTGLAAGNGLVVGVGGTGLVMGSAIDAAGYDAWAVDRFGAGAPATVSDPDRDPDGDQAANLGEYVGGTDPLAAGAAPVVSVRRTSFGPELTWEQRAGLTDVHTAVEFSSDLVGWSSDGVAFESEPSGREGFERVIARITGDPGTMDALHARIRWTLLP